VTLFLSRARLKREPSISALTRLLLPEEAGPRAEASHRLVWSLFASDPDAKRDYLFREISPGSGLGRDTGFMVLSRRLPDRNNPILDVETKEFAPALKVGDRLGFSLRANPTRTRKDENGNVRRHDVVMDALFKEASRADVRRDIIDREGRRWFLAQAARSGFKVVQDDESPDEKEDKLALHIDGYDQWRFSRLGKAGRISVLGFSGAIEIVDPALFLEKVANGIGRAKAYGCGLILIRRS